MTKAGILVETDVIQEFLCSAKSPTLLRKVLRTHVCYTTFIQVSEILQLVTNDADHALAMKALCLVRPLGAHPRYSETIANLLQKLSSESQQNSLRYAITGSISLQSKLPLLTVRYESIYSRLDIPAIKPDSVR